PQQQSCPRFTWEGHPGRPNLPARTYRHGMCHTAGCGQIYCCPAIVEQRGCGYCRDSRGQNGFRGENPEHWSTIELNRCSRGWLVGSQERSHDRPDGGVNPNVSDKLKGGLQWWL